MHSKCSWLWFVELGVTGIKPLAEDFRRRWITICKGHFLVDKEKKV